MLGVFGFILISAMVIIGVSVFNILLIDEGIVKIREHMERTLLLEEIEYLLLQQELVERAYLLHGESENIEEFARLGEELEQKIALFSQIAISKSKVDTLNDDKHRLEEGFTKLITLSKAGQLDLEVIDQVLLAEEGIDQQLEDMVFEAEVAMEEEAITVGVQNQRATMMGLIGLILFPMLAVWAFLVASRITQPLLTLTNAVVAASGGHYREDLLGETLDRHDGLGKLARAVHLMATAVSEREQQLEVQVRQTIAEMHSARRKKLVLTSAAKRSQEA